MARASGSSFEDARDGRVFSGAMSCEMSTSAEDRLGGKQADLAKLDDYVVLRAAYLYAEDQYVCLCILKPLKRSWRSRVRKT